MLPLLSSTPLRHTPRFHNPEHLVSQESLGSSLTSIHPCLFSEIATMAPRTMGVTDGMAPVRLHREEANDGILCSMCLGNHYYWSKKGWTRSQVHVRSKSTKCREVAKMLFYSRNILPAIIPRYQGCGYDGWMATPDKFDPGEVAFSRQVNWNIR